VPRHPSEILRNASRKTRPARRIWRLRRFRLFDRPSGNPILHKRCKSNWIRPPPARSERVAGVQSPKLRRRKQAATARKIGRGAMCEGLRLLDCWTKDAQPGRDRGSYRPRRRAIGVRERGAKQGKGEGVALPIALTAMASRQRATRNREGAGMNPAPCPNCRQLDYARRAAVMPRDCEKVSNPGAGICV
jgi:hypothetical protein